MAAHLSRTPGRAWKGGLIALLVAIVVVAAVLAWRPRVAMRGEYLAFGTRVSVDLRAHDREAAERALSAIGRLLIHDHRAWHPWEPSEVTALNAALAAGRSHPVPADIASLIHAASIGDARSQGLFNPAAGKLIAAWGFHTSQYPVRSAAPSGPQLAALRTGLPRMSDVQVDAGRRVSARSREVQLDFNGLAEGYAAAQMRQLLHAEGIDDALIYVGGFVLAMGMDGDRHWSAGVRGPDGVLGKVALHDGEALSSSGDYQRRRADAGQGGHIVDTRSGRPERANAAASVIAADPVLADMAATALMVAGPDGFDSVVQRMHLNCALLVTRQGDVLATPALRDRLQPPRGGVPSPELQVRAGAGAGGCADTGGLPPIPVELPALAPVAAG